MDNDIELDISPGSQPGRYQVRVVHSPAGGDQREEFDLDVEGLLRSRPSLEASILSSIVGARRSTSTAETPVRKMGRELFETLFVRSVYGAYRASLGVAQQQGSRLRVVLRFGDPGLSALPWEALFDPERQTYVCRQEPMVRRVPAQYNPRAPLEVTPPLAVLAIIASPRGLVPLETDRERSNLEEALRDLIDDGLVEITWVEQATWRNVHAKLLSGRWHVVHFIGHGDFDARRQEGVLAFVGRDGRADYIEADRFADLLGEADPTPRLVVLNACSTGEGGSDDMLSAVAPALVHSGIEAVAAMQFAISDDAAITFAQGFYTAVAHSRGVDEAARSGRIAILGEAGSLEWLTPVLYLRGDSTHPIVMRPKPVTAPPGHAGQTTTPPPAEAEPAAPPEAEPYDEGVAALEEKDFARAVVSFDKVHELNPRFRDVVALREQAHRGHESEGLYEEAKKAFDEGRYAAAARMFDVLLNAEPDYRDAAELWLLARRREEARASAAAAHVVPPQRSEPPEIPAPVRQDPPRAPRRWAPEWSRLPRRRVLLLGAAVLLVLLVAGVAAAVVLRGGPTARLDDHKVLVATRSDSEHSSRIQTFDTSNDQGPVPWVGDTDRLPDQSGGVNRFGATPSPDRTKVAYLEGPSDDKGVPYIADADGERPHKLMTTDDPCKYARRPAWNEKGTALAVVCILPGKSWSLWTVDIDGTHARNLVADESRWDLGSPTWDSDAHRIYTVLKPRDTPGQDVLGYWHEARGQTDPVQVVGPDGDGYSNPDWSPAGLLFVEQRKGPNVIKVVDDGSPDDVASGNYQNAAWAPDGKSIVATVGPPLKQQELVTIDYPSGQVQSSDHPQGLFGEPVWGTR